MSLGSDVVIGAEQLLNVQDKPITWGGSSRVKFREPLTSVGSTSSIPNAKSAPPDFGVSYITEADETLADEDPRAKNPA